MFEAIVHVTTRRFAHPRLSPPSQPPQRSLSTRSLCSPCRSSAIPPSPPCTISARVILVTMLSRVLTSEGRQLRKLEQAPQVQKWLLTHLVLLLAQSIARALLVNNFPKQNKCDVPCTDKGIRVEAGPLGIVYLR